MEFKRFKKFILIQDTDGLSHTVNVDCICDVYSDVSNSGSTRYYVSITSRHSGPDIGISSEVYNEIKRDLEKRYEAVVM